ncbi:MFS transporter [Solicola gregarius]|uniref:MFS transporter n=1 Tax=Solicola gregarius TaxID=2908642 RepID=A0AA46TKR4_9ACTN|nr:MFS transporter [Solicola gregarius]UYM06890.1 MFS transporter [Solicola gregarius]
MSTDIRALHHQGSPAPGHRAGVREWAALTVLMLPVLLVSVDNTVLSFALPAISTELAPTSNQLLWIVDIYPLMLAGLLVAMGSLGDRIGRRRLLVIGAVGFGAVKVLAAYSTTPEMLIVSRALLGVFGATLMPSTLSLLRNIFSDRRQRRLAIAVWASAFAGGAALGPIMGGWLLENHWWGSVFLITVPVIVALLPLVLWLVPESKDPTPGPVDVPSIGLSLATMLPLVYAIKIAAEHGLSSDALAAAAVGLAAGVAFVRRQLASPTPMLDVRLFTNPVFSGAVASNLLSILGYAGFLFFVAQFLQLVIGLSPMEAGTVLVPGLVASIVAGLVAVRLVRVIRPHVLIGGSFALSASGYAIATFVGEVPTVMSISVAFVAVGVGIGLAETLTNDIIISTAPAEKSGAASAISETAYEIGSVLGTAVLGSVLMATYRSGMDVPTGMSAADTDAATETLGGAVEVANGLGSTGDALLRSAHLAFDHGVQVTCALGILIALGAAAVSALTLRNADTDA